MLFFPDYIGLHGLRVVDHKLYLIEYLPLYNGILTVWKAIFFFENRVLRFQFSVNSIIHRYFMKGTGGWQIISAGSRVYLPVQETVIS